MVSGRVVSRLPRFGTTLLALFQQPLVFNLYQKSVATQAKGRYDAAHAQVMSTSRESARKNGDVPKSLLSTEWAG
jgi:hypothetical protein